MLCRFDFYFNEQLRLVENQSNSLAATASGGGVEPHRQQPTTLQYAHTGRGTVPGTPILSRYGTIPGSLLITTTVASHAATRSIIALIRREKRLSHSLLIKKCSFPVPRSVVPAWFQRASTTRNKWTNTILHQGKLCV